MPQYVTAIIKREGDGFVSFCPSLDIASQGNTVSQARQNLKEATELFLESASSGEIHNRSHTESYVTHLSIETK